MYVALCFCVVCDYRFRCRSQGRNRKGGGVGTSGGLDSVATIFVVVM